MTVNPICQFLCVVFAAVQQRDRIFLNKRIKHTLLAKIFVVFLVLTQMRDYAAHLSTISEMILLESRYNCPL